MKSIRGLTPFSGSMISTPSIPPTLTMAIDHPLTKVAPCILSLRYRAAEIAVDQQSCGQVVELIRECSCHSWPSEAIATGLRPHVAVFLGHVPSVQLLSVAMCYSMALFVDMYVELLAMSRRNFEETARPVLESLATLVGRMSCVTQYVPSMTDGMHQIALLLQARLLEERSLAK